MTTGTLKPNHPKKTKLLFESNQLPGYHRDMLLNVLALPRNNQIHNINASLKSHNAVHLHKSGSPYPHFPLQATTMLPLSIAVSKIQHLQLIPRLEYKHRRRPSVRHASLCV